MQKDNPSNDKNTLKLVNIAQVSNVLSSMNLNSENTFHNFSCPICLNLLLNPITTPCKHAFCMHCFEEMSDLTANEGTKCPMCRNEISNEFVFKVDKDLEEKVIASFPKEYQIRTKLLAEQIALNGSMVKLKILYGNLHVKLENAKPSRTNPQIKNEHKWTAFVKVHKEDVKNFIRKVEFGLHPTFGTTSIVVKTAPFQMGKVGWGTFEVPMKVYFHRDLKLPVLELKHDLSFEGNGKTSATVVKIPKELYEKALGKVKAK